MIQHFLFVKLEAPHVEDREDFAKRLRAQLSEVGVSAKVGLPADHSAAKWDLSIVIDAASLEAWHAQAATPAVIAIFDDLATRAHVTKRWSFDVGADAEDDVD
ncbi:MAG TPA: hypothetical protein VFQ65_10245 [Kofleriaceae bacterium]|nr:hypothetical protein [Kofleriaceae bacterium]